MAEFQEFPKMARWSRDVIVTEKIDGTNAAVLIVNHGPDDTVEPHCVAAVGEYRVYAQSRSRFITPADDNFGFAAWVLTNASELLKLGEGRHFGEWWGAGIQRRYGLTEKRFSLFNVARWGDDAVRPTCCHVVPTLYAGPNVPGLMETHIQMLAQFGSQAAPGFMDPEGVVMFHTAANVGFKKTIKRDEVPKSLAKAA
jgi:RNA ligase